jgi:FSR family fosmidomycin resistance protein-like MFS transporter
MAQARTIRTAHVTTNNTFQTDQVLTIAAGHLTHDIFTSFLSPLLPLIIQKLGISLTLAGTLASFQQLPSLINPLLGMLADRGSLRWFVILAPTVTAVAMSAIGIAPNYIALSILILFAGVSTAFWHTPSPAMIARVAGRQVGLGMSFFMLGGSLAYTIGPLLAVAAVSWWGLAGIWRLVPLAMAASALLYWRTRDIVITPPATQSDGSWAESWRGLRRVFLPLSGILITQGFMLAAMATFLPTLMSSEGASLMVAGGALSVYQIAGSAGALTSGTISDRLGRGRVLAFALLVAPALMLLFLAAHDWVRVLMLLAVGFTALATGPVMMALVQDNSRDHPATANGLYFALNFVSKSLIIILVGAMADHFGLRVTFQWCAIIGFAGVPFVLLLPKGERRSLSL